MMWSCLHLRPNVMTLPAGLNRTWAPLSHVRSHGENGGVFNIVVGLRWSETWTLTQLSWAG
jgi:hypothetical protein